MAGGKNPMRFKVLSNRSHLYEKPAMLHSEPVKTILIQFLWNFLRSF